MLCLEIQSSNLYASALTPPSPRVLGATAGKNYEK